MTDISSVRVGIVGLGNIGHHHADRLVNLDANLVGGMDIQPAALTRFEEKYGVAVYDDVEDLLADVDAVIITTPNRFHVDSAIAALDAGVDVLLEKPLANDLASAKRIAAAARESDAFCMVGFNNRFANAVEVVKGMQAEGRFGDIQHVEANYVRRRGIPGRGSWFTKRDISGGGSLIDLGVHAIDLALYFLDYPEIVEVAGQTRSEFGSREDYVFFEMHGTDVGPEGFDVDDSVSAFIRCADGSTINLEVAWATNRPPTNDFYIRGTDAGALFDRGEQTLTLYEAETTGADHFSDTEVSTKRNDTHQTEQAHFLAAVVEGERPAINTIEQGLAVQRVIDAIYRSAESGAAVALEPSDVSAAQLD